METDEPTKDANNETETASCETEETGVPATELPLTEIHVRPDQTFAREPAGVDGLFRRCYVEACGELHAGQTAADGPVLASLAISSDLVPRRYEGGLKTWECAVDLATYIQQSVSVDSSTQTLELGCGTGLPGIVCAKAGATVSFQDYNRAVLLAVTVPNLVINECSIAASHFYYGDWMGLTALLPPPTASFDLILSSETIYREESYGKLVAVIAAALKPSGHALIAAKDYYFGLGGSVAQFIRFVNASETGLKAVCVRRFADAVPRSIVKLSF